MKEIGIRLPGERQSDIRSSISDLIVEAEQVNQEILTTIARLQSFRKPRLPKSTRLPWLKQTLLRIMMVYTRYQELYNNSNIQAIQSLSQRLDLMQRQIEVLQEGLKQAQEASNED